MFNLEIREKGLVVFLVLTLLIGIGVLAYKRSNPSVYVKMSVFDTADLKTAEMPLKDKININEAGVEELVKLRGVGAALAGRIVEYRQAKGLFYSVEDIQKVKGIGPALFSKIKDDISTR